jgi:hypothetical protein
MSAQTSFSNIETRREKVLVKTKNSWRFSRLYLVEKLNARIFRIMQQN